MSSQFRIVKIIIHVFYLFIHWLFMLNFIQLVHLIKNNFKFLILFQIYQNHLNSLYLLIFHL